MQMPGPLRPALHRYSSTVLALGMLKALAARYLPEATRTVRMWRMFLPIWARCKWLKWRCREDRGFTKQQARKVMILMIPALHAWCRNVAFYYLL